jgi:hypothetical protein
MKKNTPESSATHGLFHHSDPDDVWSMLVDIIRHINPAHDFSHLQATFDDVVRLFRGEYPGYAAIATPYHDLSHTLSVLMCAVRLMHGVHVSGTPLSEREMTAVMLAAMLHDVGYAQLRDSATGSGAQFTQAHVSRGIEFMQHYAAGQGYPAGMADTLVFLLQSTDHTNGFAAITFPHERMRMLGQIVSTADLVGQMADRCYLEKLVYLYQEFKEAQIGNYQSIYAMLLKSFSFYEHVLHKLGAELGGMVEKLSHHFQAWLGVKHNYYTESMEKNIAYLSKVVAQGEDGFAGMLKRGNVMSKVQMRCSEQVF